MASLALIIISGIYLWAKIPEHVSPRAAVALVASALLLADNVFADLA